MEADAGSASGPIVTGPLGCALLAKCPCAAGTGLAHHIAGLIRSLSDLPVVTLTVLSRGDSTQAGAGHGRPSWRRTTAVPMLEGKVDAVIGVDTHRDAEPMLNRS
jgi:hypothetical protein